MTPQLNEEEVKRFFKILNKNKVEYLIIGGAAVNIHGYTRATGDLDIWYNPTKENFLNLLQSIQEFGFDTSGLNSVTEYETKGFIRIPLQHFYLELLSVIDGKINFNEAYKRSYPFNMEEIPVQVIGYNDLVENKNMSRRPKDLEDIKYLNRAREFKPGKTGESDKGPG